MTKKALNRTIHFSTMGNKVFLFGCKQVISIISHFIIQHLPYEWEAQREEKKEL